MLGKCKLCRNKAELLESHIIPNFVFKWMKSTGSEFLRRTVEPNLRRQDGLKKYFLCENCEKLFNKAETYFSKTIFHPYLNSYKSKFYYNEKLAYFLISILWRILIYDLPACRKENYPFLSQLLQAEEEWRKFLLGQSKLEKFSGIHLFLTDLLINGRQPVIFFNQYLTRTVDGTEISSKKLCALYAKFSRFLIFGFVTPYDESMWINTKIQNGNGVLEVPQEIKDGDIWEFLADRAKCAFEPLISRISKKQQGEISDYFKRFAQKIEKSDLGKTLEADLFTEIDPHIFWEKVGRNEKCPCGSGKKYKYCHGR